MNSKLRSALQKKSVRFGSAASAVVVAAYFFTPAAQAAVPSAQIEICGTATKGTAQVQGTNQEGDFVVSREIDYPANGCKLLAGMWWEIDASPGNLAKIYYESSGVLVGEFVTCDAVKQASDGDTVKCNIPE
jgi:hypothetical protein